jgi:phosphatidylglycerophosphate synthase
MSIRRPHNPGYIYDTCISHPSLWTRLFSNRIAALVVWCIGPWRIISPNAITGLNSLSGLALVLYILVKLPAGAPAWVAMIWLELYVIMDCTDGQLARYTDRTSLFGGTFDSLADRIVHPLLFFAMAAWTTEISQPLAHKHTYFALATILAASFSILYPHRLYIDAIKASVGYKGLPPVTTGIFRNLRNIILPVFEGMQVFFFMSIALLFSRPDLFFWVITPVLLALALFRELIRPLLLNRSRTYP